MADLFEDALGTDLFNFIEDTTKCSNTLSTCAEAGRTFREASDKLREVALAIQKQYFLGLRNAELATVEEIIVNICKHNFSHSMSDGVRNESIILSVNVTKSGQPAKIQLTRGQLNDFIDGNTDGSASGKCSKSDINRVTGYVVAALLRKEKPNGKQIPARTIDGVQFAAENEKLIDITKGYYWRGAAKYGFAVSAFKEYCFVGAELVDWHGIGILTPDDADLVRAGVIALKNRIIDEANKRKKSATGQ